MLGGGTVSRDQTPLYIYVRTPKEFQSSPLVTMTASAKSQVTTTHTQRNC